MDERSMSSTPLGTSNLKSLFSRLGLVWVLLNSISVLLQNMENFKLYGAWRVQTPTGLDGKFQKTNCHVI